ncbi:uncharacterized protein LOC114354600 [Ostrinia furnacalis]|uniref:uncharacterized protein LOC114354600 n=1 Tax=Ostrinia furnacalis TaxID=93504 RepID=UPI001038F756|nr:uncharacterized protein LOC114354600 [Ostrinia furnacalis]
MGKGGSGSGCSGSSGSWSGGGGGGGGGGGYCKGQDGYYPRTLPRNNKFISALQIDAIVNAANSRLIAGGGVDGAIHRAAGPFLQEECNSLHGCGTGEAKITSGYNLPTKYVIHTVGPRDGSVTALQSCYDKSLAFHHEHKIKSIAFPCIATGIYGFPNRLAAHIALRTARKFLEANEEMERIIFCTFMPVDVDIYKTLMQMYFPVHGWNYNDGASVSE